MEPQLGTLTEALEHHKAGRLAEAESLYRAVLARQPGHPDALHLLGTLASGAGRAQEALALASEAVPARTSHTENRGNSGGHDRGLNRLRKKAPTGQEACPTGSASC